MYKNGRNNCVCGSFDACQIRTGLTDYYIEMIKLRYTDEELTVTVSHSVSHKKKSASWKKMSDLLGQTFSK